MHPQVHMALPSPGPVTFTEALHTIPTSQSAQVITGSFQGGWPIARNTGAEGEPGQPSRSGSMC